MQPLHQRIRDDLERHIMSGEWPPGHRIPFEHELMERYGCSRMTVNKVLSALAVQGLILRRRKTGSVVATPRAERAVLEIQDFALEASRLGVEYRFDVLKREVVSLNAAEAKRLDLPKGLDMLSVVTLHVLNDLPSALEQRLINLAAVPEAREADFKAFPPGTWLLDRIPWTDAEHTIHAVNADATLARRLAIEPGKACLVLGRRTWQAGTFITEARISYPGERQHFVGRFSPTEDARSPASIAPAPPDRS
ncbi:histidine utilization repressor [Phreatobacter stygius]|uniref:Histidine utilization repressor n=1 Tax=Phreatobacter stygius TaxID=1940610 RepID=A0A4D7BAE7_9HYPH|nr:histidine utilization repressor [Phreatobacter stygius]QCI67663.1 histidine utilization repressor [Phreatobacter stygius]